MTNHPNRSKKKMHEADVDIRKRLERATEWSVYQFRGRSGGSYRNYGFKTLFDAAKNAIEIEAFWRSGDGNPRPCLIYGYVDGTGLVVPRDMWERAI